MININAREEWEIEFKEQKKMIESMLSPGEKIKHCLDNESFSGRYYNPMWVVTNMGRIYSLAQKKWNKATLKHAGKRNSENVYSNSYFSVGRSINVSLLVANYFCDKALVNEVGENNVQVHHIKRFNPQKSCEDNNKATNLQYILKPKYNSNIANHSLATAIQRGTYKIPEDTDILTASVMRRVTRDSESEIELKNNGDIRMLVHVGGTLTEEEAYKYAEKYHRNVEDFCYVKKDGSMHYGKL